MKPVIRKVWEDDIPKYEAADKDHNCSVGVSSCGTVSFGSGIGRCSSLSTMMRNWGGEHLCPGKIFSGQRKQRAVIGSGLGWGLLVEAEGGVLVSGFDEGVMENGLGEYGNLVLPMSVVRLSERVVMWVTKFAVVAVWASILVVKDLVASIKAVSWVVLRSAAVLVAEMSCVTRLVSGGWLSSPVVSRQGGMAAGELRMKAPNDGTTMSTRSGKKKLKDKLEQFSVYSQMQTNFQFKHAENEGSSPIFLISCH
ncbi:hypothetical protein Tco_1438574 [Tanacetum coccineum]